MYLATQKPIDLGPININAADVMSKFHQAGSGYQSDIAGAKDCDAQDPFSPQTASDPRFTARN